MIDYKDWKILKSELNANLNEYSKVAQWCNESGKYHMDHDDLYYKVVENPEPSVEDLQKEVRALRNNYLAKYDFTQLSDAPFTEQEKEKYAQYRHYLRDYTNQENWWKQNPLTYEEWSATNAF